MHEENRNEYITSLDQLVPWPSGLNPDTEKAVREHLDANRPLYWAIGQVIGSEGEELFELVGLKYTLRKEDSTRREAEDAGIMVSSYREVKFVTNDARLTEHGNGEWENLLHLPELRIQANIDSMLSSIRSDPSAFKLLDDEVDYKREQAGEDKNMELVRYLELKGFERGVARFKELYSLLS